ncbi:hypothetical protein D3C76_1272260 [compost metagenome]
MGGERVNHQVQIDGHGQTHLVERLTGLDIFEKHVGVIGLGVQQRSHDVIQAIAAFITAAYHVAGMQEPACRAFAFVDCHCRNLVFVLGRQTGISQLLVIALTEKHHH